MPDTNFDFDKYLSEKAAGTQAANTTFDFDKYLSEKANPPDQRSISEKYSDMMKQYDDFQKLPPEEQKRLRAEREKEDPNSSMGQLTSALRTGARSVPEAITLGASEPAYGLIKAGDKTISKGAEALGKTIRGEDTDFSLGKTFSDAYHEDVDQRRQDKRDHPIANLVGSVGGALVPGGPAAALAGKVTGLVGKGANAVRGLLPEIDASSKLGRVAVEAAKGAGKIAENAVAGGATALGLEAPRQVIEGTGGYIKKGDTDVPNLDDVAKVGALFGGGTTAAGMALRGIGKVGKEVGKRAASVFMGPSLEHINRYLENPDAINNAKSLGELSEKVDGIVGSLRQSVSSGESSVKDAKAALDNLETTILEHRKISNVEYNQTASDIRRQFKDARTALGEAFKGKVNELKNIKAPTELADEVTAAVGDVKKNLVESSQAAQSALESDRTIDMAKPLTTLRKFSDSLKVAGKASDPYTAKTIQQIDQLAESIGNMPGDISEVEAKKLLLQLDKSEQASKAYTAQAQGGFTDDVSKAYALLRKEVNEQLIKINPTYNEMMEPAREAAKLHSEVQDLGDKGRALSKLGRVANPTAEVDKQGLIKLGQATGRDFETPINRYIEAQSTLKNPAEMDAIRKRLPEYQEYVDAQKAAQMLEGPAAKNEYIERHLNDTGLLSKRDAAEGLLAEQQKGLLEAKGKLEPFKDITEKNSQQRLATAGTKIRGEDRVYLTKQLNELSKLSDTDFVKEVQNLRTQKAFKGEDVNGSRKTNLWGALAGGAAGLVAKVSGHSGLPGMESVAVGAAIGATMDKYGPAVTKKMLDLALKIEGSPTLAKIQALEAPPQIKALLAKELAEYNKADKK